MSAGDETANPAGTELPMRVLVATDGSPTATVAVRRAATLSRVIGGQLTVVTVYRREARGEGLWAGAVADSSWEASASAAANQVAEEAAGIATDLGAPEVVARAVGGDPADAILDEAQTGDADLIVVGSRGLRSATRRFLGSVPNKIVHHATCDVLVVETTSP